MKKTYKIKVKLNGKQVKYAINDYIADELIKMNKITIKELPKFIQKIIITPFKNDNYIIENGVKNTLDQMIFEYFIVMTKIIVNSYKEESDATIIQIRKIYETKFKEIDIMNDNTRKAHYEVLAKIKKEYEAEKRSLARFTNFTKEVIEENINLELMKEIRAKEIKQLEEDWEHMKSNFSAILHLKAKEEERLTESVKKLLIEEATLIEYNEKLNNMNTYVENLNMFEEEELEDNRKLKEELKKEIARLRKQKAELEKEVA